MSSYLQWKDVLTGRSHLGGSPQIGRVAGGGYIVLGVRKDGPGALVGVTGDFSPLKLTRTGEVWIGGSSVLVFSSNGTGVTASGATTLLPAPNSGVYIRVHALQACQQGNNIVAVSWKEQGGHLKWLKALGQNGEFQRVFAPNWWDLPEATALQLNCNVAPVGLGVQWTVEVEFLKVHE